MNAQAVSRQHHHRQQARDHDRQRGDGAFLVGAARGLGVEPGREGVEVGRPQQKRGGQYIGFDFESPPGIYTLKFLRDGTVIWVEVDARSGQIIGRTGN